LLAFACSCLPSSFKIIVKLNYLSTRTSKSCGSTIIASFFHSLFPFLCFIISSSKQGKASSESTSIEAPSFKLKFSDSSAQLIHPSLVAACLLAAAGSDGARFLHRQSSICRLEQKQQQQQQHF